MNEQPRFPLLEIDRPEGLWSFLDVNPNASSVWLITWKAAHPDRYVSREDVLDALVAHGWIDGRRKKLDADRTMQLIAPRRTDVWARSYRERAERLIADGRMRPAGMQTVARAKRKGLWTVSDPIDDLLVPDDLRNALIACGGSAWFDAAAPSYRRNVLRYLASAKRAETRERRLLRIASHAARREKVPQAFWPATMHASPP
jgi:uncharacterized protein YdeI (YjbR/CyaY-like superfamily)